MPIITFRSPVTTPLKRLGQCSSTSDDFCVTQQFNTPDYYWSNVPNPPNPLPTHGATDIGNFRCGYPIVAMAAGIAYRIQDNATSFGAATNALGIRIDHGQGITTEYWHLASWTVANGARVVAGQEIGKLGATGLGATCHTHIEAKRNGVKFDPEPLMFGGSIGEDDVQYPRPMFPLALTVVAAGNNLRRTPSLTEEAKLLTVDATVGVHGVVTGERWISGGVDKGPEWLWVGYQREMWCVHSALVGKLTPTVTLQTLGLAGGDCSAQDAKLTEARLGVAALRGQHTEEGAALEGVARALGA